MLDHYFDRANESWQHLLHGQATLGEKVECGIEALAGMALIGVTGKIVLSRGLLAAKESESVAHFNARQIFDFQLRSDGAMLPKISLTDEQIEKVTEIAARRKILRELTAVDDPTLIAKQVDRRHGADTTKFLSDTHIQSLADEASAIIKLMKADANGARQFSSAEINLNRSGFFQASIGNFSAGQAAVIKHTADQLSYLDTPAAKHLSERLANLANSAAEVVQYHGGEAVMLNTPRRLFQPLHSVEVSTLAASTRFKMLTHSRNIFEIESVADDGRVFYHHVDFPESKDWLNPDAIVKTGSKLVSEREELGLPEYLKLPQAKREQLSKMTDRGLQAYKQMLEIPDHELDTIGRINLDIGAGAQQELARDVNQAQLGSTIIPIDPGLALSEKKDMSRLLSAISRDYRRQGRSNPQPFSIAASGDALPFATNSVDSGFANYSLPYWSKDRNQTELFLSEVQRVVKPGGTARIFPVDGESVTVVERWLASNRLNDQARLKWTPNHKSLESADYHLLTIQF